MRHIIIFLLFGVALASEVAVDDFTLRIKTSADQLQITLNELGALEEGRISWFNVTSQTEKLYQAATGQVSQIAEEFKKMFLDLRKTCSCEGTSCKCCTSIIPYQKICVQFKINMKKVGVAVGMTWNKMSYNKEFSVTDTNLLCIKMPLVSIISACINPKDISFKNFALNTCFGLGIHIDYLGQIISLDITCVEGSIKGIRLVSPKPRKIELSLLGITTTI